MNIFCQTFFKSVFKMTFMNETYTHRKLRFFYGPGFITAIMLFLRRTLVRLVRYSAMRNVTTNGNLYSSSNQKNKMSSSFKPVIVSILFTSLSFLYVNAQNNNPVVKVSGEVTKPLTLSAGDVAKMKRTTATMKDRDGKEHTYAGVAIQDILEQAGVTTGSQLRGENLTKYLLVKCADGYQVVFSLAELDSSFTNRVVILADESEGKPLPIAKGPFRLIVPDEKKPARSSFQVTEFIVKYAKD